MSVNVQEKLLNLQQLFNRVIADTSNNKMSQQEIRILNKMKIQHCDTFLNNLDITTNDIKKYITRIKDNCRSKL